MKRKGQRGSTIEIIPVVFIGLVVAFGAFQVALYMSGKHAAELAAFRASRALEARSGYPSQARAAARHEVMTLCAIGYPSSCSSAQIQSQSSQNRVQVSLTMEPLIPLPVLDASGSEQRGGRIAAQHPPVLDR